MAAVGGEIATACKIARRKPEDVTLIAISKTHPAEAIVPLIAAGQSVFGENRVQEAQGKWPAWQAATPGIELHLLGPLQSNKVRPAVELFDTIHSLDRLKLARRIADIGQEVGRVPRLFVQVNTGDESQKAGIAPEDVDAFVREVRAMDLPVQGLMCIPPADQDPAPHFDMLADLAARNGLAGLSMGMSADFEQAIARGATHIRIGSAIFGERTAG